MKALLDFVQTLMNMGAVAILPIMILIIGLIFRMKFGEAFKAGLLVGIGFQGLSLVINLLFTTIDPAVKYYAAMGHGYTVTDMGWAAVGAASWSVPFAAIVVPVIFLINVIMIRLKWTKTMNVDIWNFIHMLIPGALAYALTQNMVIGILVTLGCSIIAVKGGDYVASAWQDYFGLEGTTCSTTSFVIHYPIFRALDKLYDHIPGFNKVNFSVDNLSGKLGVFGESSFIGVVVGVILGLLTRQPATTIFTMAIGFASVLVLIPRMVAVMMEGISPLGQAASVLMKKWLGEDAELNIGMDVCLGLGDPTCIVATALMIPFTILCAFIIPNMQYFPVGILSVICYMCVMPTLAHRGNFLRTLISCIIMVLLVAWATNVFAPEATMMMHVTGVKVKGIVTDSFFGYSIPNVIIEIIHRLVA
jgi:PTS system galactitol-specific IIC component